MAHRNKKRRRILRLSLKVLLAGGVTALVVLFLLAERRPAWYVPIRVTPSGLTALRRDVTIQLDDISRKMVEKQPFTITWTQQQLTERLAAFPDLWPESRNTWPAELFDPVVRIEEDSIRVGAFFERSGWRAIVCLRFAIGVPSDSPKSTENEAAKILLRLREATVGSLRVPNWLLRRCFDKQLPRLDRFMFSESSDADSRPASRGRIHSVERTTIDQLLIGLLIPNRFTWPNGRRPFRITRIQTTPGTITLHIQPT